MSDLNYLKKEIEKINERNSRVGKDKAWETSVFRRVAIAVITYILISIFLIIVGVENPFVASIVPAVAFLISTATLSFLRNWWLEKQ